MEIELWCNPSEVAATYTHEKSTDIYFTSVTQMAESTFSLSSRQMALWRSQMEDHTSDWLRVVPISGLGQTTIVAEPSHVKKRVKYEANCADIRYRFSTFLIIPLFGELENDAGDLTKADTEVFQGSNIGANALSRWIEFLVTLTQLSLLLRGDSLHGSAKGEISFCPFFACLVFVDDTIVGDTMVVRKVLELIMKDGPGCGLHLNIDKTKVFWPKEDPRSRLAVSSLERIVLLLEQDLELAILQYDGFAGTKLLRKY
ncbi:hypothetical protein Tco_0127220 [Tanacetum coccineum]